jgi:hypothetical protein
LRREEVEQKASAVAAGPGTCGEIEAKMDRFEQGGGRGLGTWAGECEDALEQKMKAAGKAEAEQAAVEKADAEKAAKKAEEEERVAAEAAAKKAEEEERAAAEAAAKTAEAGRGAAAARK